MKKYLSKFRDYTNAIINNRNKQLLKNKNFSLISSNCLGGFMLHNLNIRFNTPTINLFFYAEDYIKFLENLKENLSTDIIEVRDFNLNYPVGKINDEIIIHFMHYKSFNEAKEKWEERAKRVDFNNLFIIMTDRDGCDEKLIKKFDDLPFENKVIFTHKPYPEIKSTFFIKEFIAEESVGHLFHYKQGIQGFFGYKYYDNFDYVSFFNKGNNN